MARIRKIEIERFRGIESLSWAPKPGINCLIGPGDSGKSTVLEAVDWCLGTRRTLPITDADFYLLDVEHPIQIDVTIGNLGDGLQSLESYGLYLQGFDAETGEIADEPADTLENTLTVRLTIGDDLDPQWTLVSGRAAAQGYSRNLSWADRVRLAPTRIGTFAAQHLTWQKGSILTRLSDEKTDAKAALANAARQARESFGTSAGVTLEETLLIVKEAAERLGVGRGGNITAMLDAHSVSFSGGSIALHDENGVPLRKLGLGSSRLLVAGLQNAIASEASIALIDEVEHGLEPHRIARLLVALGSKDAGQPLQIFMTTHSPVVLRELGAEQLHVIRQGDPHVILPVPGKSATQGSLRKSAEAYLGTRVLVCEGATEVGLIRGIDLWRNDLALPTFLAAGGVPVDAGGVDKIYHSAREFLELGYSTAVLRDDDKQPDPELEERFTDEGGTVFKWSEEFAFEDELFSCVTFDVARELYGYAAKVHGASLVRDHLCSACSSKVDPDEWLANLDDDKIDFLAEASKTGSWFKRISIMEEAARSIVGPALAETHKDFKDVIEGVFKWVESDGT